MQCNLGWVQHILLLANRSQISIPLPWHAHGESLLLSGYVVAFRGAMSLSLSPGMTSLLRGQAGGCHWEEHENP